MDSPARYCPPARSAAGSQRTPTHNALRLAWTHAVTRLARTHVAALLALFALAHPARASLRPADPGRRAGPTLVAPAEGERMVESAVRFAFETPPGATAPVLVLARHPFGPASSSAV